MASYMYTGGPLGWLYPSEIQPLETRSAGQGIATLVNLLFSFIIGQTYLSMLCAFKVSTAADFVPTFAVSCGKHKSLGERAC